MNGVEGGISASSAPVQPRQPNYGHAAIAVCFAGGRSMGHPARMSLATGVGGPRFLNLAGAASPVLAARRRTRCSEPPLNASCLPHLLHSKCEAMLHNEVVLVIEVQAIELLMQITVHRADGREAQLYLLLEALVELQRSLL